MVVSALPHMSPGSSVENQLTTLLPGMRVTDNCLVHNYPPNPVVNEMNDLVILVSNGPHCTKTHHCICEAGKECPAKTPVRDSDNRHSQLKLDWGGEAPRSYGCSLAPGPPPHKCQNWKHVAAK